MPPIRCLWSRRSMFSVLAFLTLMIWSSADASAQVLSSPGRIWTLHGETSYCPDPRQRTTVALIYDAQTGSELQRYGFADANGNFAQIVTGLAFDTSRRSIWYTLAIQGCAGGPAMGDGFIYRRPAADLVPITAIPAPGGVGGPAIGSLDYDPEEDVIWAPSLPLKTVKVSSIRSPPPQGHCLRPFRLQPLSATWAFHNQTTRLRSRVLRI